MTLKGALAGLLICCAPGVLSAQSLKMAFPVDCTLGKTCFIEDYMDIDPREDRSQDYACGLNTRDNHRGTDIALITFEAVDDPRGVDVRAAAPGQVLRVRDSMVDDRRMPGVTSQNACGNAVLLRHADGYETLYCHLRRGSVSVKPGARVKTGDVLGQIGLSGQTTHPHLHLTVLKDGTRIDPFRPGGTPQTCDVDTSDTLWAVPPVYHETLIRLAGFSDSVPSYDALRGGTARKDTLPPDSPMVVYAETGFAQDGDRLTISATGPTGEVFRHTRTFEAPKKSQLPAYGKKAPPGGWPEGEYTGQLTLTRDGVLIANRWAHVTVER